MRKVRDSLDQVAESADGRTARGMFSRWGRMTVLGLQESTRHFHRHRCSLAKDHV